MKSSDLALFLACATWACSGAVMAVSEVLTWRLSRAFRAWYPELWTSLDGRVARLTFFFRREHLRLGDAVLDARAERLWIVDRTGLGLFFGGVLVIVVDLLVLAALRW